MQNGRKRTATSARKVGPDRQSCCQFLFRRGFVHIVRNLNCNVEFYANYSGGGQWGTEGRGSERDHALTRLGVAGGGVARAHSIPPLLHGAPSSHPPSS